MPTRQTIPKLKVHPGVALVLVLVCLGLLFRVANLEYRVFWVDEVATAVRVGGRTVSEVIQQLTDGRARSPEELLQYQRLAPATPITNTIQALVKSPEHPPLYFLLARLWVECFGSSVTAIRSLSVVLSLIALPCLYGVCLELFQSVAVAWASVGVLAICPFFVSYAQEARPYGLWVTLLLLSSGALLRAMRLDTLSSWSFYALVLGLSFYTSLISVLVTVGYSVYVLAVESWRFTRRVQHYAIALGCASIAFIPWVVIVVHHWDFLQANTVWAQTPLGWLATSVVWFYSLAILFFDVPVIPTMPLGLIEVLVALGVLGLIVNSFRFLHTHTPRSVWLFPLTLSLATPGILIGLDILRNSQISAVPRYLIPTQLSVLVVVAYFLGSPFGGLTMARATFRHWQWITAVLLSLSLLSCVVNLERSPQYQKTRNVHNLPIAAIINQAHTPLVWAESQHTLDLLSLAHSLKATVRLKVLPTAQIPTAIRSCQPTFVLNPSPTLTDRLQAASHAQFIEVYEPKRLVATELALSLWLISGKDCSLTSF
jgi:uncharacterized membrane protein